MPGYTHELLADILLAQGVPQDQAERIAETILRAQVAAGLVTVRTVEQVDRDARAYRLRGERLTALVIGERLGLVRSKVFEAVRRHHDRRKQVLRVMVA